MLYALKSLRLSPPTPESEKGRTRRIKARPRHSASGASQRGMSGCDRTPHRSDVSVSPTHARTHARGMRVYWVSRDARAAQNGFPPRHACARRGRRRRRRQYITECTTTRTYGAAKGACLQATTCVEGRRLGKWRLKHACALRICEGRPGFFSLCAWWPELGVLESRLRVGIRGAGFQGLGPPAASPKSRGRRLARGGSRLKRLPWKWGPARKRTRDTPRNPSKL